VVEVDASGLVSAIVTFDPDDLDVAYAELDARYASGEGRECAHALAQQRAWMDAFGRRDLEALAAHYPAEGVVHDHRKLGFGVLSASQYAELLRPLVELAPDARVRVDHFEGSAHGSLMIGAMVGTRDGGEFEMPRIAVRELDPRGALVRIDHYDHDQLAEARARFEELGREQPEASASVHFANAAWRSLGRMQSAYNARDWDRFARELAADFHHDDRRPLARLDLDRAQFLEGARTMVELSGLDAEHELVATRGDRLALVRARYRGAGRDFGQTEIAHLLLIEVDENGKRLANVAFDQGDLDAAYEELDARYDAGEAAPFAGVREPLRRLRRAVKARDWNRMAAVLAPDFVAKDHRPVGVLTFDSGEAYVAAFRALVELAPDAVLRTHHVLAIDGRGALVVGSWAGTRDGGAFEMPAASVFFVGPDRRIRRVDFYGQGQLGEARARFEELRPDPLRIPPNAATRARDRWFAAFEAGDREALEALVAPGMHYEDRERGSRVSGDRATLIQSMLSRGRAVKLSRTLLATAGDRLALERVLFPGTGWQGIDDAGEFEQEFLVLVEIDAGGRTVAAIFFEPIDRRAASREMFERWFGAEGSRYLPPAVLEALLALNDHDFPRLRAALPADFLFEDHRRTGLGRLEGVDAYLASLTAIFELSPDGMLEPLYQIALDGHGTLAVVRSSGTLPSGGEWESIYVQLVLVDGDRLVASELFELEDLERAKARFEELRPAPCTRPRSI
jgi:hypothetical protein